MARREKWVRRFTVDESSKHDNRFTIYKITSVLFPIESPEAVTVVSVWKRYSDVQQLHKRMKVLHLKLHLRGKFPDLIQSSYFKRFQKEVIEERAKSIQNLLEFIAEHGILFTSTDFVNFLKTGYPEPIPPDGTINSIRSSLQLPTEDTPPIEYQTSDEDSRSLSFGQSLRKAEEPCEMSLPQATSDLISQITIFEAEDVEMRETKTDSFSSLESLDSLGSDLFDELRRVAVDTPAPAVKRARLPDLISFDAPCSSSRSGAAGAAGASATEDAYVFEAGHLLNLAAKYEQLAQFARAFDCYKAAIDKMLRGAQADPDPARRALVKQKTEKYLAHAEGVYGAHLRGGARGAEQPSPRGPPGPPAPLRRPYEALAHFRVLAVLSPRVLLVLDQREHQCYAMKVIQKTASNLSELDEQLPRRPPEPPAAALPSGVPYMVALRGVVETDDRLFLLLSHAPGQTLLQHARHYARARAQRSPRALDLENVLAEPAGGGQGEAREGGAEVDALVRNARRLLLDVDRALSAAPCDAEPPPREPPRRPRSPPAAAAEDSALVKLLPAGACTLWAAQLLLALEGLQAQGAAGACRELRARHVLLGARGQALLTYRAPLRPPPRPPAPHVAPELLAPPLAGRPAPRADLCDFWSYGALLYELFCGLPLAHHHGAGFTAHTALQLPEGLGLEQRSLLAQLLAFEPARRLGGGGAREVQRHPYFRRVDWPRLQRDWQPD